jgi:hypothetical protein
MWTIKLKQIDKMGLCKEVVQDDNGNVILETEYFSNNFITHLINMHNNEITQIFKDGIREGIVLSIKTKL